MTERARDARAKAQGLSLPCPSPTQYSWHEQERIMFVCLDPCTWQGREYDDHSTPLERIDPRGLDVEQWMTAAHSWGAREILLVCKHTGGFCWWPTRTTDYCVRSIPWHGGKGNLVAEVAEACRRHGLSMGVYIYSDDPAYMSAIGRGGRTDDPLKQPEWNAKLRAQWEEVLRICGPELVREVWFDGSCVVPLGDILGRLAPNAVVLQSPAATIRWVGNEKGIAPDPNWNTLSSADLGSGVATAVHGSPDGDLWAPVECDTTLYDHNWFWSKANEAKRKSLADLFSIYIRSVGRGSVLLLNSTPNTEGLIPEGDLSRYRELGDAIERSFDRPLAEATDVSGTVAELDVVRGKRANCCDLWEDYRLGHRIRAYEIEGRVEGRWVPLARGTAVGRRKLDFCAPVRADRVRLRVTDSIGTPAIRRFAIHEVDDKLAVIGTKGGS